MSKTMTLIVTVNTEGFTNFLERFRNLAQTNDETKKKVSMELGNKDISSMFHIGNPRTAGREIMFPIYPSLDMKRIYYELEKLTGKVDTLKEEEVT